jgi:hypothetical protein
VRKILLLILGVSLSLCVFSQGQEESIDDSDSVAIEEEVDSTITYKEIIYRAEADSSNIAHRPFGNGTYRDLKNDPDLDYKQPPTVAESLWSRLLSWISQIINAIFENAVTTNWGRILVYAIALALLIVIIMMILKVNAFKVLYSGEGQAQKYQVLDENIHEMDFDKLIKESLNKKDYRRGVRLTFLYALKLLNDKHLIHFETGKTNHDYVAELTERDLKTGFNELSFYFDYAWYGNFAVNYETFRKVDDTFQDWKNKIRA